MSQHERNKPPAYVTQSGNRLPDAVYRAELVQIRQRRERMRCSVEDLPGEASGVSPSPDYGLVGLALSGGGIRSATINLGLIQAMARAGWLKHVDYLSTVSGGGFIGSCLSALLNDERRSTEWNAAFPFYLETGGEEPPAMAHLRNHASYLEERGSGGPGAMLAILLRGLIVNALALVPFVILLAFGTRWAYGENLAGGWHPNEGSGWYLFTLAAACLLGAACVLFPLAIAVSRRMPKKNTRDNRRRFGRVYGLLLSATGLLFLLESTPWLLNWLVTGDGVSGGLTGVSLTSLAAVVGSAVGPLAQASAGKLMAVAQKVGIALAGLLGPSVVLLLFLNVGDAVVFGNDPQVMWTVAVVGAGLLVWNLLLLDVNSTSLLQFYRDRLSNTFLRRFEQGDDGSEKFVDADGLRLGALGAGVAPYHLVNVNLNVQGEGALELRGRGGDFFVFSQAYCGGRRTGYRRTDLMEAAAPDLNLGTAMAISGAAVAPNMGAYTQNALVVLMTLLNLRLGRWIRNPRYESGPLALGLGLRHLLRELLGRVDSKRPTINVSDGGHLENTGIFPLLERRCRVIICGDAEADPAMAFGGLATVIRYAASDLGVHIDINLDEIRHDGAPVGRWRSKQSFAVGKIRYSEDERDCGWLIYVKSAFTGTEPEHVRQYRAAHPDFPHESTADQFFNEAQFEAYRALGFKQGIAMCHELPVPGRGADDDDESGFESASADGPMSFDAGETETLDAVYQASGRSADPEPAW